MASRRQIALGGTPGAPRRRSFARHRDRYAGAACLGQPDRDRLLGGARAVLALADVMDLFAHELAGGGTCTIPSTQLLAGSLERGLLGHPSLRCGGWEHASLVPYVESTLGHEPRR